MTRLEFVHVGLAKTASTFLQRQVFPAHPSLAVISISRHRRFGAKPVLDMLALAEPGWFDTASWRASFENLVRRVGVSGGDRLGISNENLSGHMVTGAGAYTTADRLAELFRPVKVVLVLRHPLAFVESMYNQYVRTGGTLPLARLWDSPALFPGRVNVTQKLDYPRLLAHYRDRFGQENLLVLPFELLRGDAGEFVARLWRFLGVEPGPLPARSPTANPSWPPFLVALIRLGNGVGLPWRRTVKWVGRLRRVPPFRGRGGGGRVTRDFLCRCAREFGDLLQDERYAIWDGDLARYNYTFGR